ncbi:hypothetical protein D3C78_1717760 [compost metagenome]
MQLFRGAAEVEGLGEDQHLLELTKFHGICRVGEWAATPYTECIGLSESGIGRGLRRATEYRMAALAAYSNL